MSGSSAEGIFKLLFFFVGLCILIISFIFLPFAISAHKARTQKQRDAMAAKARGLGLEFDGEASRQTAKIFKHLDQLDELGGSKKHALNVMSGDHKGHPVTLFDFHYATSGPWFWSPSWTIHHYASFVVLHLDKDFPELTIGTERGGLFSKIAEAFGGGDIDFESHEFSEAFDVRSKDKKFAYDFCNAQMIEFLLDKKTHFIEVENDSLAMGYDGEHRIERMDADLDRLMKIRGLMPNYLFDDDSKKADRVVAPASSWVD